MTAKPALYLIATFAAHASLLTPSSAFAESATSPCQINDRVLPTVTPLPANAPAVVVLPPLITTQRDAGEFGFRLLSDRGEAQAIRVEEHPTEFLLRPVENLQPGY